MGRIAKHEPAVAEKVEHNRQHGRAAYREPNRRASEHESRIAKIAERRIESADSEIAQKSHSIAFWQPRRTGLSTSKNLPRPLFRRERFAAGSIEIASFVMLAPGLQMGLPRSQNCEHLMG